MTQTAAYPRAQAFPGPAAAFAADLQARLPRLETARLVLRAPTLADFETYAGILTSERFAQSDGQACSREEAWFDFANYLAGWLLYGAGLWTITDRGEGRTLGFVLVGMEPGDIEPELGYFVTPDAEGKGLGFEAASAARAHARETLLLPSLVSYIAPGNDRSARLAARLGATRDSAAEMHLAETLGEPVTVWRHWPQPEACG